MKTLYGHMKDLDGCGLTKANVREPKKFWHVDFEWPDAIWRGHVTESPTFKNLFEVWNYELTEATVRLEKCTQDMDKAVWQRRIDVANQLLNKFNDWRKDRKSLPVMIDEFYIEVTEDVLH